MSSWEVFSSMSFVERFADRVPRDLPRAARHRHPRGTAPMTSTDGEIIRLNIDVDIDTGEEPCCVCGGDGWAGCGGCGGSMWMGSIEAAPLWTATPIVGERSYTNEVLA